MTSAPYQNSTNVTTVTLNNHGFVNGQALYLVWDNPSVNGPTGRVPGVYSIYNVTVNTFAVAGFAWSSNSGTIQVRSFPTTSLIRASHNVSSVSYNGTGDYTVNFSSSLGTNVCALVSNSNAGSEGQAYSSSEMYNGYLYNSPTSSSYRVKIEASVSASAGGYFNDAEIVCLAAFAT